MSTIDQFHFLRPEWLLGLIPAFVFFLLLLRRYLTAGHWQHIVDPELWPHVLDQTPQSNHRYGTWWILLCWLLACLALAGPTWEKHPTPVQKNRDALVILLDMSLSMGAQDIKPSRAVRAIQKVTDILRGRVDGLTALLTYSGEAHTVTPLTDDRETIENLLPALSPFIMPKLGSRADKAIQLAQQLVTDAGITKAQLLMLTDGLVEKDVERIQQVLDSSRFQLSIIALGSKAGAPVALPNQGFLKDGSGNIVLPRLDEKPLNQLNSAIGVPWRLMTLDDKDWKQLLSSNARIQTKQAQENGESSQFDLWVDQGYWLIFFMLPMALMIFRRGVLFSLLYVPLVAALASYPPPSYAVGASSDKNGHTHRGNFWDNLWQTPDQQAAAILNNKPKAAAQLFDDKNWQGVAAYQAGDYQQAADAFAEDSSANGHYNRGNALAQAGKLQQALDAYDQALSQKADFEVAKINREIVKKALEQQKQQQKKQPDNGQKNDQQDDKNQPGSSDQNNQNSRQKNSDSNKNSQDSSRQQEKEDQEFAQQKADEQAEKNKQASADQQNAEDSKEEKTDAIQHQQEEPQDNKDQNNRIARQDDKKEIEKDKKQSMAQQSDTSELSKQEQESQAAMQQWLNRVPDNPGNLLQRKFLYQYRQQHNQENEQQEDVLW